MWAIRMMCTADLQGGRVGGANERMDGERTMEHALMEKYSIK